MNRHHLKFDPFRLVQVIVVGAGGTGSHLTVLLTELHKNVVALGGRGLAVTVYDPDTVSATNVLRQNYHPQDIGRNKAVTLISRVNMSCGLNWRAVPTAFRADDVKRTTDVLITCTDSNRARREIGGAFQSRGGAYWIDTGNDLTTGQVIISEPNGKNRLPSPLTEYADQLAVDHLDAPSCSALEALSRQDLLINREIALKAAGLLWRLLRNGCLDHRGLIVNLSSGVTLPKPIEPDMVAPSAVVGIGLIPAPPPAPTPATPRKRAPRKTRPAVQTPQGAATD